MVAEPPDTPVTIPLDEPTVATDGLLEDQAPPIVTSLNCDVALAHIVVVPVIDPTSNVVLTLTVALLLLVQAPFDAVAVNEAVLAGNAYTVSVTEPV